MHNVRLKRHSRLVEWQGPPELLYHWADSGYFDFKEALNKSVGDLSEATTGKRGFLVAYKINRLERLILAVHPYTAEALS